MGLRRRAQPGVREPLYRNHGCPAFARKSSSYECFDALWRWLPRSFAYADTGIITKPLTRCLHRSISGAGGLLSLRPAHPSAFSPAEAVLFNTAVGRATRAHWAAWPTTTHATSCSNGKSPHQHAHRRGTSTDGGASCRRWQSGIPSTRGRRPSSTRAGTRSELVAMSTDRLETRHPSWSSKRAQPNVRLRGDFTRPRRSPTFVARGFRPSTL